MGERKVLLRVTGDGDDAKRTLRDIAGELLKIAGQKAVAEVRVNTLPAKAELRAFKGDLDSLSTTARVDLKIAGAQARLADLTSRLERLGTLDASPKVEVRVGQTVAQIERVEAQLATLNARRAEPEIDVSDTQALTKIAEVETALQVLAGRDITAKVRVKVDRGLTDIARLRREAEHSLAGGIGARAIASVLTDVSKVGASFASLGAEATTLGGKIAGAFVVAGGGIASGLAQFIGGGVSSIIGALVAIGAALAALAVILTVVGPLVIALVGALFALVAVAVSAAGGIGALGIALLAAFGPVAAVIAFVAVQINKIVEAQKKQAAAAAVAKNALASQQQAQASLASAQENQSNQRLAALQAERDATNALTQSQNALQNAQLGVEGAKLNLDRAKADLKGFKDDQGTAGNSLVAKFKDVASDRLPGALDGIIKKGGPQSEAALDYKEKLFGVKTALQGVKNSEQAVRDAQIARGKAQSQVNEFQSKGLRAFDGYDQALKQTGAATTTLAKATTTLGEAERKRDEVLGELSPTQAKFAKSLTDIKDVLEKALGPAADEVFAGMTEGLEGVSELLEDDGVQSSLRGIGRALGDVIRLFGRGVSSRGFKTAFSDLAEGGAELTRVFGGQVLPDVFRLLLAIAQEALPSLKRGARGLGDSFHGFVDAELSGGRLHRQIRFILRALSSVGRLGQAAIGVLIALFPEASQAGETLVDMITRNLRVLRRLLSTAKGKEDLKEFFANAVETVRDLANVFEGIVSILRTINSVFDRIVSTIKTAVDLLKTATDPLGLGRKLGKGVGSVLGTNRDSKGGLLGILKAPFGANGGIAVGPTIAGEAGHEALIPLRPDVLERLGATIAAFVPAPSTGLRAASTPRSGNSGKSGDRYTTVKIESPAGHWPDMGHALATLDQRLNALGA